MPNATTEKQSFTDGIWHIACDSYGRVQHSRKACVFSSDRNGTGDYVAQRIPNWNDARLIAAAKDLLEACHSANIALQIDSDVWRKTALTDLQSAIAKATEEP